MPSELTVHSTRSFGTLRNSPALFIDVSHGPLPPPHAAAFRYGLRLLLAPLRDLPGFRGAHGRMDKVFAGRLRNRVACCHSARWRIRRLGLGTLPCPGTL